MSADEQQQCLDSGGGGGDRALGTESFRKLVATTLAGGGLRLPFRPTAAARLGGFRKSCPCAGGGL